MNSFVEDVPVEHLLRENTTARVKKTMHGFSDGTWEKEVAKLVVTHVFFQRSLFQKFRSVFL